MNHVASSRNFKNRRIRNLNRKKLINEKLIKYLKMEKLTSQRSGYFQK